jgi:hypothetical protein
MFEKYLKRVDSKDSTGTGICLKRNTKSLKYTFMHISTACPGGHPLKKHDSNTLIPPPSPGKCVSQTALPLGLRIK